MTTKTQNLFQPAKVLLFLELVVFFYIILKSIFLKARKQKEDKLLQLGHGKMIFVYFVYENTLNSLFFMKMLYLWEQTKELNRDEENYSLGLPADVDVADAGG